MRQQHAADHIACRIHAGYGSRIAVIHLDESLFRQLQVQGEQCPLFFVDAVDLRFQALNTLLRQREGQKVGVV